VFEWIFIIIRGSGAAGVLL